MKMITMSPLPVLRSFPVTVTRMAVNIGIRALIHIGLFWNQWPCSVPVMTLGGLFTCAAAFGHVTDKAVVVTDGETSTYWPRQRPQNLEPVHQPPRLGVPAADGKYLCFWLLGSLSVALMLLIALLSCCTRRGCHCGRRMPRDQVLPGGVPRTTRPRLPTGDPHSREILLCPACRSAQEEMFRSAKAVPVPAVRWSPPPPYTPHPAVPVQPPPPDAQSHL